MASMKRNKTRYPGVFFIVNRGKEKVYYIMYRKGGKQIEEKVGKQFADDMTPARASGVRADRMQGKSLSNSDTRQKEAQETSDWSVGSLWNEYSTTLRNPRPDINRWNKHLKTKFSKKKPKDLVKIDTDRIRTNLLKSRSPQTVKHVLALLRRILNYGIKQGHISPLAFKIEMPRVDNAKTEDLTPDELERLLRVLEESPHTRAASIMKIALFSGMRRGEIFKLKWTDVDFQRGFICIRDPKGGKSQDIPLNANTRDVIEAIPNNGEFLFPSRAKSGHVSNISKHANAIKKAARLPDDFRPMHGLRHLYATLLANSGKVDMYTLQKLLTHKSPEMTQRYAHLRDEVLKKASCEIDTIFSTIGK